MTMFADDADIAPVVNDQTRPSRCRAARVPRHDLPEIRVADRPAGACSGVREPSRLAAALLSENRIISSRRRPPRERRRVGGCTRSLPAANSVRLAPRRLRLRGAVRRRFRPWFTPPLLWATICQQSALARRRSKRYLTPAVRPLATWDGRFAQGRRIVTSRRWTST